MEAATPKRAAVRLAVTGGGLLLTVGLLVATAQLASRGGGDRPEEIRPEWDVIDTGASYQLPQADPPMMPVAIEAPAYEPPAYQEPVAVTPAAPVVAKVAENPAAGDWQGPVTIHNPAAFGPPEDDSLPPVPSAVRAPDVAPRVASRSGYGPSLTAPVATPPFGWREPGPLAGMPVAELTPTPSELGTAPVLAENAARAVAPTAVRPLQELSGGGDLALLSYTASTNDLSKRLAEEVQAGFQLGKSGAVYAARGKFVSVLRQIALAKDAEAGTSAYASALAEGLRTLDDADDFVPRGDALEAELDVAAIAGSHGLRLADEISSPHEAIARYSQHAATKLATAAASEPAGSMALYGLGKTYARLEAQGDDATAGRKSLVMFRAAVDTHAENYLAANELGVRLARAGRYRQASQVLRQAATRPTSIATVHANLAAIEQRLGNTETAALAKTHSERLALQERATGQVSKRHGVDWVDPNQFHGGPAQAAPAPQVAATPNTAFQPAFAVTPAPAESGWSSFVRKAKRATGWSSTPEASAVPVPAHPSQPVMASQPRVLR